MGDEDGGTRTHVAERMVADGERKRASQTSGAWRRRGAGQAGGTSRARGPWGFMGKKPAHSPLHPGRK